MEAPVPDLRMTSTSDLSFLEMEIEASGIVDPAWYMEQYPDIRPAGDRERLEQSNYLSMSVVMHDRSVTDMIGGFDEELTHLVDWDFFLRMTEVEIPARIPVPRHHYYQARTADSITANNPVEINVTRIRAKLAERLPGTRTAQESKK